MATLSENLPPTQTLVRVAVDGGLPQWAVALEGALHPLRLDLTGLCRLGVAGAQAHVTACLARPALDAGDVVLHAPVDGGQEVWAAGVTYERSRSARIEESGATDLYGQVYESDRPELFFKAIGARVVRPGGRVGIRADATWSVPEPELAVVFDATGEALGFLIGDDVSSRDIEGSNALYLPQAKVYDRSCALGPGIVPIWVTGPDPRFGISMRILRDGAQVFEGSASTTQMRRHWRELGDWLGAALSTDDGVILLTGTGIVPGADVTLEAGDRIEIEIDALGRLESTVSVVGRVAGATA